MKTLHDRYPFLTENKPLPMPKKLFTGLVLILLTLGAAAQGGDKEKIEKEKQELQNEIKEIEGMYNKVQGQTRQSINQLGLIKRKLDLQNRVLGTISREIKFINDDLYLSNVEIYRLQKQLDTLKEQYAKSIVYTYKNRGTFNFLNFIFSANGFADALKRIAYLRSYRVYRQRQVENIAETQKKIEQRKNEMIAKKNDKNKVLGTQSEEAKKLEATRREQSSVVSKLKSQQKDIEKQLAAKRKRSRELQNQIDAIVRRAKDEAIREAKRKAAEEAANKPADKPKTGNADVANTNTKPATNTKTNYLDLTEADVALNDNFEQNKGRLPWPVVGDVQLGFGRYEYFLSENSKPLIDDNPGVTFSTNPGTPVKSIFKGEVAGVTRLSDEVVVVIRHGKYFTTYTNLTGVTVKKGDQVSQGQVIGRAGTNEDGNGGKIDFILMDESRNVNPEIWLRKK